MADAIFAQNYTVSAHREDFKSIITNPNKQGAVTHHGTYVNTNQKLDFESPFPITLGLHSYSNFSIETNTGYIVFTKDSTTELSLFYNGVLDSDSAIIESESIFSWKNSSEFIIELHHTILLNHLSINVMTQVILNTTGDISYHYYLDDISNTLLKNTPTNIGMVEWNIDYGLDYTNETIDLYFEIVGDISIYSIADYEYFDTANDSIAEPEKSFQADLQNIIVTFHQQNSAQKSLRNIGQINNCYTFLQGSENFEFQLDNVLHLNATSETLSFDKATFQKTLGTTDIGIYLLNIYKNKELVCQQKIAK